MNRFNLTFSGEILAGEDPEQVMLRFADMFGIDDRVRLERFFSGETIILRRNLERKDAAQLYHQLQVLGAAAALVKVTTSEMADDVVKTTPPDASDTPAKTRTDTLLNEIPNKAPHSKDAAAEIKARKLAAQRLAAEKAASEKADKEAQQRAAAEEAALQAAKSEELKRLAEEENARKKALKVEASRRAAEEAAERKARRSREKAEKAQRKAEVAAQRKAEAEEKKRVAAEEEARRKAELAEQKRLAEEAEARRKAALAEEKRLTEEAEARRRAELAEEKRLAEEAEARRQAELQAKEQQAAQEKARRKAALEKKKRLAAEKEARRRAAHDKAKRIAAEEEARKSAAAASEAAALHAELEEKARRAADERPTVVDSSDAQPTAHALSETVKSVGTPRPNKPVKSRVKTSLDVPLRQTGQPPEIGTPGQRKRQPAAPNLYKLQPFRNSQAVKTRNTLATARMRQAYTFGTIALAILLIVAGSFLQTGGDPGIAGASAVAINTKSEPVLLAGDLLLLHDRAGVSSTAMELGSLGVKALQRPMVFASEGSLLALGRLGNENAGIAAPRLLRCDLQQSSCALFTVQLENRFIDTFTINRLNGSVLLADTAGDTLLKMDSAGAIIASASTTFHTDPVLRLHGGLLLMNSATGPAIGVYRYENSAFGTQLDEILLLPPSELPLESSRVSDFIYSGDAWWVILRDSISGAAELHRFDNNWSYLDTVPLVSDSGPLQLIAWGQKTLVNDPYRAKIQRFSALGTVEAPFASTQLQALIDSQQQQARLASIAWNGALLVCGTAVVLCFGLGYLHRLRTLVYNQRREQGAQPVDDQAEALHWIEPVRNRHLQLRRTGTLYGLCALGVVLLAIIFSVSVWQLAALLLLLSGPAAGLLLLSRKPVGHIGILGEKLLLVDHSGQYHLGGGPRLHYRGPFLSIDDIVVFTGSRLLPAFSPAPLRQHISPEAMGGIKVDNKTIAVKLLECRHPLALGGITIIATAAVAALILLSQGLF